MNGRAAVIGFLAGAGTFFVLYKLARPRILVAVREQVFVQVQAQAPAEIRAYIAPLAGTIANAVVDGIGAQLP